MIASCTSASANGARARAVRYAASSRSRVCEKTKPTWGGGRRRVRTRRSRRHATRLRAVGTAGGRRTAVGRPTDGRSFVRARARAFARHTATNDARVPCARTGSDRDAMVLARALERGFASATSARRGDADADGVDVVDRARRAVCELNEAARAGARELATATAAFVAVKAARVRGGDGRGTRVIRGRRARDDDVNVVRCDPRLRGKFLAAMIPGDSAVESVITSGIFSTLNIYNTLIIGRLILTWFPNPPRQIMYPLATICDPYLNLFRGIIPPLGGIDLSPILAFTVLNVFQGTAAALPCEYDEATGEVRVPEKRSRAKKDDVKISRK